MHWEKLLSSKRYGKEKNAEAGSDAGRTEFQRDFDRIIFSSSFRRLQNKTQVVPLPESDYVRNRLTHSLETSCVGRSLGRIVGKRLDEKHNGLFTELGVTPEDFGSVVAAACLAHDLGNPPFGHAGEDIISEFFSLLNGKQFIQDLPEAQQQDLKNFEGNAAGFRILTYTFPSQSEHTGGLRLTYTTLAAFTKYPGASIPVKKNSPNASEKKYGFFQAQKDDFKTIANDLQLKPAGDTVSYQWKRHPLAFLVEAADDICYHIIDIEDAAKMKIVSFEEVESFLTGIFTFGEEDKKVYDGIHDEGERIGYLRSKVINQLIYEAVELFIREEENILDGTFDTALTAGIPSGENLAGLKDFSVNRIYKSRQTLEIEAAGYEVINGLLDVFITALLDHKSRYGRKMIELLPKQYLNRDGKPFDDPYLNILNVTAFVSGMTDTYAINLYRTIKGLSLTSY